MSESTIGFSTQPNNSPGLGVYWGLFSRYLRSQWGRVILLALLILSGLALQLVNPQIIRYFLDAAESGQAGRNLYLAAALFILFAIVQRLVDLFATYVNGRLSWSATNRLRSDLAAHCLELDMSFHKRITPGEIIERIDGDVSRLGSFFSQLFIRFLSNGLLVIGILVMLFRVNPLLGWGMALYAVVTLSVLGVIQKPAAKRWAAERQASAEQFGFLEEQISGTEDIRSVGAEPYVINRLLRLLRVTLEKVRSASVMSSLTYNLTNLIYAIGFVIGLAIGVYLYLQGEASLGTAYLVVYYIGMLSDPLQNIREQAQNMQMATASIQRVEALFAQQPNTRDPALAEAHAVLPVGPLSVEFENVSFHYDESEDVLKQISFRLEAGAVLGILGRTGSGKSTMTSLLFRLYDPGIGSICLDGVDLRSLRLSELRQRVGMVTQDVQLFDTTIRENLTLFDPNISVEQLEAVLRNLRLWEWVQSLPDGLETRLAAGRQGLSAGEAQLLAFARVFLKDPGVVILDEASSRLDPLTETLMEKAIDGLFARRTGLIIAHRLRTVQRADQILILDKGQIVEYGHRLELAADPGSRYFNLLRTGLEEVLA
jgi:ATP-binding cassette subfamily B protein